VVSLEKPQLRMKSPESRSKSAALFFEI